MTISLTLPATLVAAIMILPSRAAVDFAHDVVPVLKQHCVECHLGTKKKGGLSMNTRAELLAGSENGKVVEPGKPDDSLLLKLISSADPDEYMPPKGERVPAAKIAVLRAWIAEGLAWEDGFSFGKTGWEPPLKPRRVELPAPMDGREHPIDRLIDRYLADHKVPRPETVNDAAFARRVSIDVLGLLPELETVDAITADAAPDKRTRLVTATLARDVEYAEHWLSFWNDLLRNDYQGTGYIDGGRKPVTAWLYRALLTNMPYDQFARELLAPPSGESEGFIQGIKWRGNVNASQVREVQFSQSVSQVFLGINMKCASCHDSFIDRWKLDDAYALAAIYSDHLLEVFRCDKATGRQAKAGWIFPELGSIDASATQPGRLKQLAGLMTHPDNGRFTRTIVNRIWHRLMGRGIVHPVDAMHTEPWNADLLDWLSVWFAEQKYDVKKLIALICGSQAWQSRTVAGPEQTESKYIYRGPVARRLTAEQFVDAVWRLTGTAPGAAHASVPRGKPGKAGKVNGLLQSGLAANEGAGPVRASVVPSDLLQRALGRPNREQIVSMRPENLTTLEAIDLANGNILAGLLQRGAQQILTNWKGTPQDLAVSLCRRALSRPPAKDEAEILTSTLGANPTAQSVEDALWMLLMLPEFQFVR